MTEDPNIDYLTLVKAKAKGAIDIASSILFDALVFCFWILVAWGCFLLSDFIKAKGFNDYLAEAFKWCSSLATFIMAIIYIIIDVHKAINMMLGKPNNNV